MGGRLKFGIYSGWIIGVAIGIEFYDKAITIYLPFISIHACFDKEAEGYEIFGWISHKA